MIGFVDAVKIFFRKYVDFSGRATRAEYWWVALFQILVLFVLLIPAIGMMMVSYGGDEEFNPVSMIGFIPLVVFFLAIIIPNISLFIRRLHDINLTGWVYLGIAIASFIPIISFLASIGSIVIACIPGTVGSNKYGPDPFGSDTDVFN